MYNLTNNKPDRKLALGKDPTVFLEGTDIGKKGIGSKTERKTKIQSKEI